MSAWFPSKKYIARNINHDLLRNTTNDQVKNHTAENDQIHTLGRMRSRKRNVGEPSSINTRGFCQVGGFSIPSKNAWYS